MSVIYKYPVTWAPLYLPQGAEILSAGLDPTGALCIWARVNPGEPLEPFIIYIVGTGGEVPAGRTFIGTVLQGPWVWHFFK